MEREIMFAHSYFELPGAMVFANNDNNINANVNVHLNSATFTPYFEKRAGAK